MFAEEKNVSKSGNSGAVVRVKIEDALKLNDLKALKETLLEMEQTVAILELDNQTLREEKEMIYREFIETQKKYQEQNGGYRELQLMLSDAVSSNGVRKIGGRESELLSIIDDISVHGGELALKSLQFCEFVGTLLNDLPLGKVAKAELQLKIDALKKESGRFIALNNRDRLTATVGKCRIISVSPELSCVILSAGSVHGAFNGLIYRVGKPEVVMRVVAVRPFVSAALVTSGNVEELAPGMEASSSEQKTTKK